MSPTRSQRLPSFNFSEQWCVNASHNVPGAAGLAVVGDGGWDLSWLSSAGAGLNALTQPSPPGEGKGRIGGSLALPEDGKDGEATSPLP